MKTMTRWLVWCTATAVALFGFDAALAQDDGPPKPGPEHKRLGYFVGTWKTAGNMQPSAMGPGGKVTFLEKCDWFEGGFAVVCHSEGTSPMGPVKSIGILSYSMDRKAYTYSGVDSTGMTMTSVPLGKREGDTWVYDDESMMGGKRVKSRITIKEVSPSEYTFKMEMQTPDGEWAPVMMSKSTKTE